MNITNTNFNNTSNIATSSHDESRTQGLIKFKGDPQRIVAAIKFIARPNSPGGVAVEFKVLESSPDYVLISFATLEGLTMKLKIRSLEEGGSEGAVIATDEHWKHLGEKWWEGLKQELREEIVVGESDFDPSDYRIQDMIDAAKRLKAAGVTKLTNGLIAAEIAEKTKGKVLSESWISRLRRTAKKKPKWAGQMKELKL